MADTNTTIDASGGFETLSASYAPLDNKIVRDSTGKLWVVYQNTSLFVKSSTDNGATWSSSTQITGSSSVISGTTSKQWGGGTYGFFILINKDDTIAVAYYSGTEIVTITKTSGQAFSAASVQSFSVGGINYFTATVSEADNWMYIGYLTGVLFVVRYYNGIDWSNTQTLANNADYIRNMLVDNNKNIHSLSLSLYNRYNWNGSSWGAGAANGAIVTNDFAYDWTLDNSNNIHIIFSDAGSTLKYIKGTNGVSSTTWGSAVTLNTGTTVGPMTLSCTTGTTLWSFVKLGSNYFIGSASVSSGFSSAGSNVGSGFGSIALPLNLPVKFGVNSIETCRTATNYCFVYLNSGVKFFLLDGTTFDSVIQSLSLSGAIATTYTFSTPKLAFPTVDANDDKYIPLRTATNLTELTITDSDYSPVTYSLVSEPSYGYLVLNGTKIAVNDTFAQSNIDNGDIIYVNSSNTVSPTDTFQVKGLNTASGAILATKTIYLYNLNASAQIQSRILRTRTT